MADQSLNPYAPPSSPDPGSSPAPAPESDGPKGFNLWLILSLIGVIGVGILTSIGVVRALSNLGRLVVGIRDAMVPWQFGLVLVLCASLSAMAVVVVVWMLQRDRRLPKLMLVFYALQAVMIGIVIMMVPDRPMASEAGQQGQAFGRWFWPGRCLLYLRSERVKNTFVN